MLFNKFMMISFTKKMVSSIKDYLKLKSTRCELHREIIVLYISTDGH